MDIFYEKKKDDYYLTMAGIFVDGINKSSIRASSFYLKSSSVIHSFISEINDFCSERYQICKSERTTTNEKHKALAELREEDVILNNELISLQLNNFSKYLYLEVSKLNGVVTYVIKGLAFVGGVGQVAMGLPLIFAPGINGMGGAVFGVALVAHGANNIYESIRFFTGTENSVGYVRDFYRGTSKVFGGDDLLGDKIYAIVDIGLSLHGLFSKFSEPNANSLISISKFGPLKIKNYDSPHTGRIFKAVNADFKMGIQRASKLALSIEIANDFLSFRTIY
ncbi:DUF4225 domain-containing protein [Morganella sp. GD04133]|uniref:DUF4225 domain-containing protein n=1 Tax=Morganella sp. GD04133 TaxID=2975435 RepID=UPI00244A107F|nr:DUF4225 domain-containing protein [Morganella sp. GD04133]MDH0355524.1 DUF4225 domain-containing protein [Morganella sp. GD04133]